NFVSGVVTLSSGSLTVGAGGLLGVNATLSSNQTFRAPAAVTTIASGSTLTMNSGGSFAGIITNGGTIAMAGGTISGTLTNNLAVTGYGTIAAGGQNAGTMTAQSGNLNVGSASALFDNTGTLQNNVGANVFVTNASQFGVGQLIVNGGGSMVLN